MDINWQPIGEILQKYT